jgi:antirestriction protein ArdC
MAQLSEKQVEQYAELIAERIRTLEGNYHEPWVKINKPLPQNLDGRNYTVRGLNSIMLAMNTEARGYETPVYITFHRAKEEGVRINRGEIGTWVGYTGQIIKEKDTGARISQEDYRLFSAEEKERYEVSFFSRTTKVFNLDQTNVREARPDLWKRIQNRMDEQTTKLSGDRSFEHAPIEYMLKENQWIIPIEHSEQPQAYYSPSKQIIHLPYKEQFVSNQEYYSTAMHEMAHSTSVPLSRAISRYSEDWKAYAREELVAELTASIGASNYGFEKELKDNNVQYIKGWLREAKEDPSYLKEVVEDVHKASNFIIKEVDAAYDLHLKDEQQKDESKWIGKIEEFSLDRQASYVTGFIDEKSFLSEIDDYLRTVNPDLFRVTTLVDDPALKEKVNSLVYYHYGPTLSDEEEAEYQIKSTEEYFKKEEEALKDKLISMYVDTNLMTSDYLKINDINIGPIARLIEGKEGEEPIKEVIHPAPDGLSYDDLIREEIRLIHPSLPELPTDRQREEIIENFLRQPSVELSDGQGVNTKEHLLVTMNIPNNNETRRLLEERSVDFKSSQETLSYNAVVRYREGLKIEGTEENKRALDDLGISATPLKDNKLFVPLHGNPEIGKLMTSGIKSEVTYGMAELPVLRKESLEERIGRSGITDGDSRSLLLKGESLIVENDRGNKSLVYIDQTTNQVRSIPTSQIPIPNRISSIPLRFDELQKLRSEGSVELFDKQEHVYHRVELDVRESDNFKMEYKELSSEKYKPVPTVESSDKEKIDYIALRGAKAIDDIWGKEALKKERDSFLERYDVQETYREYLDLKEQGEPGNTIRQNEEIKEVFKDEQRKEQKRGLSV